MASLGAIIVTSFLLSGCLRASTFGSRSAAFPAPQSSVEVMRLYLDEVGDIYPDTNIVLRDRDLRAVEILP
jgi:hypothetical protein